MASRDVISLLKQLDARVTPASEFFANSNAAASASPPASPSPRRAAPPLESLIPHAERIGKGADACYLVESRCDLSGERSPEGFACPAAPFAVDAPHEALTILNRDGRWAEVDLHRVAFIDTETTSLSGGSGTCAFLIGIGRFEPGGFVVRQYFMPDYTGEETMIDAVARDLAEAQAIVSYNGKCFDLPLMETRWRMQRRRPEFPALHFDLLFPARKLWRKKLADCRLGTVEREVLRILRVSDIESFLIPNIYFEYLRGVAPERLLPVFDHHAQDIYSLGALTMALARAVASPDDPRFAHAAEQWGLASIYQRVGRHDDAVAALERAIVSARDEEFGFKLSMQLAKALRRMGRDDEALEIWRARAEQATIARLDPLIELAKHAEHRRRDFAEARAWTERALAIVQSHRELASWVDGVAARGNRNAAVAESLTKRLARIQERERR